MEKYINLFRHLPELQEMRPRWHEIVFGKLFQIAEVVNLPPEERLAYENSLKSYRDLKNVTDTAFDEGREIGAQQKALEVARTAIAMGLPDAQIATFSGLSEAQIADLRRQGGD